MKDAYSIEAFIVNVCFFFLEQQYSYWNQGTTNYVLQNDMQKFA